MINTSSSRECICRHHTCRSLPLVGLAAAGQIGPHGEHDRWRGRRRGSARRSSCSSGLPRRYDRLSAALSFWQDPRWRRALVDAVAPRAGERILDVATGTGMVAAELRARADCTVVGLDQSPQMLAARAGALRGRGRARGAGRGGGRGLPFADASFDALTFTYLLRYVDDPPATMRELARVVRPGGRVASLEFGVPPRRAARAAWRLYTAVGLPALGRVASREWAEVGRFLGPSIRGFYAKHPLERIVGYWRDAGLGDVRVRRMSLGGGVVMSARKLVAALRDSGPRASVSRSECADACDRRVEDRREAMYCWFALRSPRIWIATKTRMMLTSRPIPPKTGDQADVLRRRPGWRRGSSWRVPSSEA